MGIHIIAAIGKEREIGIKGELPWHLPTDLKRFRQLTKNEVVIMGRKTLESIGKPLPDRLNIILTRNPNFEAPDGTLKTSSLHEALELVPKGREVFVIGGTEVFAEALKIANKMHITYVDTKVPGADAHFPEFNLEDWEIIQITPVPISKKDPLSSTYVVYERR